ncbi:MAG: 3,4-dihydroxy-2-butanone-4-phosphate synthase, partial [Proteobacteria bacterium]|nr:3,4-dihydroxy-2-butanone-4-phosphate synthase [Pseudomonadota bacterium]
MADKEYLATIPEIIEDAKQGKMCILVDGENRENEGDLVIPAQMCDDKAVNFMAKFARGLICLPLTEDRIDELGLPLMSMNNKSRFQTAFTVSIEAKEGVTTGISAQDRAKTIADAIDPKKSKGDLATPGHIFPLRAQNGGVLVRAGHTEAAVDIARLAGLNPSGVICEIMNDDGSMARLPELIEFAKHHDLKIATIADLIKYRRYNDKLVERKEENAINSRFGGDFKTIIYKSKVDGIEHLALVKGNIKNNEQVMVRMHHLNFFSDILGDIGGKSGVLQRSMDEIAKNGSGVVVIIRQPDEPLTNLISGEKPSQNKKKQQ